MTSFLLDGCFTSACAPGATVFNFMLATMMIPGAVRLIPAYVLMMKHQLINTYGLILPAAAAAAGIFLLAVLKSIPKDLEEAAVIDETEPHADLQRRDPAPVSFPALLTVFIIQFRA